MQRLALIFEYATLPLYGAPLFDSAVYVAQAGAVRGGRFGDPTLLAFSPLYGYFLAVLGAPADVGLAPVVQIGFGVAGTYLAYRIGRERFGDRAALVAGLLFVGYGQLAFYETKLLSETLGLTLAFGALLLYLSEAFRGGRWQVALGAGLLLGLATLARASLVLVIPWALTVAVCRWTASRTPWRPRLLRAGALAAGLAVVLGGYGLWTWQHAGVFVPVVYSGGDASIMAHASGTEWTGDLRDVAFDPSRPPSAWDRVHAVERALRNRTSNERTAPLGGALAGVDPWATIRAAPSKLARTLGDLETGFQYSYYGERRELPALAVLPVTFGILELLGLVGAILLTRRAGVRALLPYLPYVLGVLTVVVLYHPSSRYRLPMVLPLIPLAAHGAVGLWERARGSRAWAVCAAAVLVACLTLSARTMTYELRHPARWDLTVAEAYAYEGDVDGTLARVREARSHGPLSRSERVRASAILRVVGRTMNDVPR